MTEEHADQESPTLRCCALTVAVIPVSMGNKGKTQKPLAKRTYPLGFIDPKDAHAIMEQFIAGEDE